MKFLVLLVCFFSIPTFAADLNLNGGDSVTIQANVSTRVTCGAGASSGGSGSCEASALGFKALLDACMRVHNGAYCQGQHWPKYKSENAACKYAGIPYCLAACEKVHNGSYCAGQCQ